MDYRYVPRDEEDAAYTAGQEAYYVGKQLHDNPHKEGTPLAEAWEIGWQDAVEEDFGAGEEE